MKSSKQKYSLKSVNPCTSQRSLFVPVLIKRRSTKPPYTYLTRDGREKKKNDQKLPCRSAIKIHKYSSIFQVFIVLIMQTKGTNKWLQYSRTAKLSHTERDGISASIATTDLHSMLPFHCNGTGFQFSQETETEMCFLDIQTQNHTKNATERISYGLRGTVVRI